MNGLRIRCALVTLLALPAFLVTTAASRQQDAAWDPSPPDHVVRLVFIHHSSGENWLADDNGGLGQALSANNYYVSDTNYGWGPDAIGDRTDIPNWLEWFRSDGTDRYMQALFSEGEQHAGYTRTLPDPGGENQIVLFKSCFPNSALEGRPDDAPSGDASLSVGGAKYVYNQLLDYFRTRPDRLFIVITAPPLISSDYADNARAFNEWLVNDWLAENGYTLPNVAVFDFYNVLTGTNHHHRLSNGAIEHVFTPGHNLAAYPSEDDHPSSAGNRKATEEFVPLLNAWYHRWAAQAPAGPGAPAATPAAAAPPPAPAGAGTPAGSIDDFESGADSWTANWDASTPTTITCAASSDNAAQGSAALRIDFDVAPGSWATCSMGFESPQDWSGLTGIAFQARFDPATMPVDVDVYAGPAEAPGTFAASLAGRVSGDWTPVQLAWEDVLRVAWEEEAGSPLSNPGSVQGMAFGVGAPEGTGVKGTVWIDDVQLLGAAEAAPPAAPGQAAAQQEPAAEAPSEDGGGGPSLPCASLGALPLAGAMWLGQRRGRARSH
jgi:hypothetical protein